MPEANVIRGGTWNPLVWYHRRRLAAYIAKVVKANLWATINGIERRAGTEGFEPLKGEEIVVYVPRALTTLSLNAGTLIVELMPGDEFGRRGREFLVSLRTRFEELFDLKQGNLRRLFRWAKVDHVEVCAFFKSSTGSLVIDGRRVSWGEPKSEAI